MKKYIQTVKRRYDWVTACGLVIFTATLILEIITAVSVPVIIRREGLFAEEIMKTELTRAFDAMRRRITSVMEKTSDEAIKSELMLISSNANFLAEYLREHLEYMTSEELIVVTDRVKRMDTLVLRNAAGNAATGRLTLDTSGFIRQLTTPTEEL